MGNTSNYNTNVARRNEQIKEEFKKLNSANKYKREYIFEELATKYFLKASTVERIVWGQYEARRNKAPEQRQAA